MHETPHAFFHLDAPAPGAELPAGAVKLQGWAVGKPGHHLVDLRARVGAAAYPAVYGFLRADLARHFGSTRAELPAEFELTLPLPPGEHAVELDGCDITGAWRPLHTLRLRVTPPADGTVPPPAGPVALGAEDLAAGFRRVLRLARDQPWPAAIAAALAALPSPAVTRYAHAPWHSHLHHPGLLVRGAFGRMLIEGWLFHETTPVRRVAATVDLHAWQTLEHGDEFDYVPRLYPQFPLARACRINGGIDVPAQLPQPVSLRLYAELATGGWQLCHVQRASTWGLEEEKSLYAAPGLLGFWRAWRDWTAACRSRGFALPERAARRAVLLELWREHRAPGRSAARAQPAPPAPALPAAAAPLRSACLVTHNLNLEGAPLFLLEFARQLAADGTRLRVLSPADGPLGAEFARLGAEVQRVDLTAVRSARTAADLRRAIAALAAARPCGDAELVVANTLACHWAVHLARHARRPSLYYIHESTTPASFLHGHQPPAVVPVVMESFAAATHVSFLTAATRRYYEPFLTRSNHSLNPGWIDLAAIDAFRRRHDRARLREELGIGPDEKLVLNLGTVCDRKGQQIFVRAVDLLWRDRPDLARPARFDMVGARATLYDAWVRDVIAHSGHANLRLQPESPAPYRHHAAADLFVCSSYEESFPRVVLEAMAFGVPILSSGVHGVPEMVRDGVEARLVPPGDSAALAAGMAALLEDAAAARALAAAAERRVRERYDAAVLLPRHAALAAAVARA